MACFWLRRANAEWRGSAWRPHIDKAQAGPVGVSVRGDLLDHHPRICLAQLIRQGRPGPDRPLLEQLEQLRLNGYVRAVVRPLVDRPGRNRFVDEGYGRLVLSFPASGVDVALDFLAVLVDGGRLDASPERAQAGEVT